MEQIDPPAFKARATNPYIAPVAVIAVTVLLGLGMVLGYRAFTHATKAMTEGIKEAFSTTEKITQTFRSEVERVISTRGNRLELAVSEANEYFRSQNEKRAFGGNVYLGTTSAEIDALCTFRYHLELSDDWSLEVRSNLCLVHAPRFRPSLPVAIHTGTMRKHADSGWARFDKNEQLNVLESGMTAELAIRATDERHLRAVRESCRQSVADFVRNWLLREDHWRNDRFSQIVVQFPDEPKEDSPQKPWFSDRAPVIQPKSRL